MKKGFLSIVFAITLTPFAQAQVKTPQPSPHAKIEQTVGLTDVTVDYSRPGVKGRTVFGDLVPYNKLWRTGANENTRITFSDDVMIDGKTLEKGTYAIFTKPGSENWQVYFYKDAENWGLPKELDKDKIALQTVAKVKNLPFKTETFSIMIGDLKNDSASLNFIWENTVASLHFRVPSEREAMKSIEATMAGSPTVNDYYAASSYFFSEGKDLKQALQWMEKAVKMSDNPPYYMLRQKSLLEAEMGMMDAAIESARKSLKSAEKAGNTDYIKMNQASLKEWGAM